MPISQTRLARAGSVRVALWQRQRLGDADRRRIMEAARHLKRHSHQPGWHGGALRRTGILVLWALLYRGQSRHGVHDPALSQLAKWAGCTRSTVQDTIVHIDAAGIMGHVRRGVTVAGRWCQWTNAYFFASPAQWALSDTGSRAAKVSTDKKKAQKKAEGREGGSFPPAELVALAKRWGLGEGAMAR